MLRPESWAVIAIACAGIIAAGFAYARTPPEQRRRVRQRSIEERLAASAPESRAVIIRADWRRALRRDLPWLLATIPLLAFAAWFEVTRGEACASLFGVSRTRIAVSTFFVAPPLMAIVAILVASWQAVAAFRGGYWPPLDRPTYADTLAVSGRAVKLRALGLLALSLLAAGLIAYGYARSAELFGTDKLWARLAATEARCGPR